MSQRKTLTIFLLVVSLTLVLVIGAIFYVSSDSDSTTSSSRIGIIMIPIWIAALTQIMISQMRRKDKHTNDEVENSNN